MSMVAMHPSFLNSPTSYLTTITSQNFLPNPPSKVCTVQLSHHLSVGVMYIMSGHVVSLHVAQTNVVTMLLHTY